MKLITTSLIIYSFEMIDFRYYVLNVYVYDLMLHQAGDLLILLLQFSARRENHNSPQMMCRLTRHTLI